MDDNLTLRKLKNTNFPSVYKKYMCNLTLSDLELKYMIEIAVLLINSLYENTRKLGYRIIVEYSIKTGDYKPLYSIAINQELIPISHFIENNILSEKQKNVYTELNEAFSKQYEYNNIYLSREQKGIMNFYNNKEGTITIVAPTSYGKSEMFISTLNNKTNENICIIVPTKSLLAQTKSRIIKTKNVREKIITHPEMYTGREKRVIAVLTQERLLRLLKNHINLSFDIVIVDEAHELLGNSSREKLLASVIVILEKRNPLTSFKFVTPFLHNSDSIKIRNTNYINEAYHVKEYIKTEKIYLVSIEREESTLLLYDQFMNDYYEINDSLPDIKSEWDAIVNYSGNKNIVYLNKPKDIEEMVSANLLKSISDNESIKALCKSIGEYIHPKYKMIDAIKKGIVYHHGSVPEPIRLFVEREYTNNSLLKYMITSSTLLEGVNIPADKMFILDNKKGRQNLNSSEFNNLIGRVCRFHQIFDEKKGTLHLLEPQIYIVKGKYVAKNSNIKAFLKNVMYIEKKAVDKIDNVMLNEAELDSSSRKELESAQEFIENVEEGTIDDYNLRMVTTEVGKSCFQNNITEIDILKQEIYIKNKIESIKGKISNIETLLEEINDIFLSETNDDSLKRMKDKKTRTFYSMFIGWIVEGMPYRQMIECILKYWKSIKNNPEESLVYVGRWGDETRGGHQPLWTDVRNKTETQLINLAIIRIKEEQDYIENKILKFIEVLNDFDIIEKDLYYGIKYGTTDEKIILAVKNGFSLPLAKLVVQDYLDYIIFDKKNELIEIDDTIVTEMREKNENDILICEMESLV